MNFWICDKTLGALCSLFKRISSFSFIGALSVLFLNVLIFAQHEQGIRKHVEYLSSPLLQGRFTGSLGQKLAAIYIQNQLDSVVVDSYKVQRIQHGGWLLANKDTLKYRRDFFYQGLSKPENVKIHLDSLNIVECTSVDLFVQRKKNQGGKTVFLISDWEEFLELFGHEFLEEEVNLLEETETKSQQWFVNKKRWSNAELLTYNLIQSSDVWHTENLISPVYYNPKNKGTWIFCAHYDHLGKINNEVYLGADDNASGVSVLLELAKKIKSSSFLFPMNIVFVFFSAEEQGLLGSRYFVENSAYFPSNLKRCFNFDMVGFVSNNVIQLIHYQDTTLLDLQPFSKQVLFENVAQESFLHEFSSDHQSFANQGIPSTLFFTGLHSYYHTPKDSAEKLNYAFMNELVNALYQKLISNQ